jgi:hypothetical protein
VAAFDLAFTPRADVPCAALNAYPGIDRPIFRIDLRRRFTSWNNRYVDGLLRRGRRYFRGSRWPCNSRDFRERNPHLEHSNLPPRAAAATSTLILILVSSMAAPIHQPLAILGIEILLFAVCCWLLEASSARKSIASQRPRFEEVVETVLGQVQVLPFIIGGITLLTGRDRGLYWIAGAVITIFIASTVNARVLLVEISR